MTDIKEETDLTSLWVEAFFGKQVIISTLQTLLKPSGRTLVDLQQLCTISLNTDLVPALTNEGLLPFINNYSYVYPYDQMSKSQLNILIDHFQSDVNNTRHLYFAQEYTFYYVKTEPEPVTVDAVILLYGAVRLMQKGLVSSHVNVRGHNYACELNDEDKNWYIDNTVFKIVNSSRLPSNTLRRLMQEFAEHSDASD